MRILKTVALTCCMLTLHATPVSATPDRNNIVLGTSKATYSNVGAAPLLSN